eukprot:15433471-Alexandrium_andersonii.AAC.1
MFAATPPLEALRLRLSDLVTQRRGRVDGRRCGARNALLIDACKAHLRAYVDEDVYVALPPAASMALVPLRPAGRRCALRPSRAS